MKGLLVTLAILLSGTKKKLKSNQKKSENKRDGK